MIACKSQPDSGLSVTAPACSKGLHASIPPGSFSLCTMTVRFPDKGTSPVTISILPTTGRGLVVPNPCVKPFRALRAMKPSGLMVAKANEELRCKGLPYGGE